METGQLAVRHERALAGVPYGSAGSDIAGINIGCTNDFPVVDVPTRRLGRFRWSSTRIIRVREKANMPAG